jgi:hypothetical protein
MSGKYKRLSQKRRADKKRAVIDRYKRIIGCADCGYNRDSAALEFDHLPGFEKSANVASLMYASWDRIKEEIVKCEVVCSNCHAIRTKNRTLCS